MTLGISSQRHSVVGEWLQTFKYPLGSKAQKCFAALHVDAIDKYRYFFGFLIAQ